MHERRAKGPIKTFFVLCSWFFVVGSLRSVNIQKKPRGSTARPNGCVDQLSHSFYGSFNEAERNDFLERRPRHYEPRTFFCLSSGEAAPTHYSPLTIDRRFPPIYGFMLFPFRPCFRTKHHTCFLTSGRPARSGLLSLPHPPPSLHEARLTRIALRIHLAKGQLLAAMRASFGTGHAPRPAQPAHP